MSLKRKTGAEQEARLARQEVEGLTQARDWLVFYGDLLSYTELDKSPRNRHI